MLFNIYVIVKSIKSNFNLKKFHNTSRGFTLIELLVVIAIIGLLSSVILTSLNSVRAKARDTKAVSEFRQLKIALALYYDKYRRYPNETPVLTNPWVDNFNSMATQLVTEKFLAAVPVAPANHIYSYYNYGKNSTGGLIVTILESAPNSTTGISPSCRPFIDNWCNQSNSKYYCICNPY